MTDDYVIVLTTMPAEGDRLAACVNLLSPMTSIYRWDGQVERETERQIIMKTTAAQLPALWDRLRGLHPYDVPEFVVLPVVDGSDAYLKWIGESTAPVRPEPA